MDYVIYTPKYFVSNGIRVLFKLADELIERGYNVYLFSEPSEGKDYKYINKLNRYLRDNAVVVYPEIVLKNPLNAKNVVRYVLYYPGVNGGDKYYDKNELVFTFNREYYEKADLLPISTMDTSLFYKDDTVKDINCYFVNKGGKWKEIPEFKDFAEINMLYPSSRKELADLLRRTKTLYSYDRHTLLAEEAYACGCNVKYVTESGFEDFVPDKVNYYTEDEYKNFIDNFINKTQNFPQGMRAKKDNIFVKILPFFQLKKNRYMYINYRLKYYLYSYIFNDVKMSQLYWFRSEYIFLLSRK